MKQQRNTTISIFSAFLKAVSITTISLLKTFYLFPVIGLNIINTSLKKGTMTNMELRIALGI